MFYSGFLGGGGGGKRGKITKTCQTGYTNHDRHKIKIEHDIIDKAVKLDILNEIPPQVNEIPAHFIHEIKTKGYDVT